MDLQRGTATIAVKPGGAIAAAEIFEAIRHAGLRPVAATIDGVRHVP